jgi:hypothetical protein
VRNQCGWRISGPALRAVNVAIIAAVFFTGGLTTMLWNITTVSFHQRVTPNHLLGRVNSTTASSHGEADPSAPPSAGRSESGVRSVFALMGLFTVAVLIPNRRITEQALTDAERI